MTMRLVELSLQGFRAYLAQKSFDLRPGKSLAVFAPNAKGKSSLVDAIEVFFSESGTLKRLGPKKSDTKAGPEALEHVAAETKKIPSSIRLTFRDSSSVEHSAERLVKRPAADRAPVASSIVGGCKHDFIIRGHELRSFVEMHTPEERYSEVSNWFGLTPLVTAQKNLRTLRREITRMLSDDSLLSARAADLNKATGGAISSLDEADILAWINDNLLAALDKSVRLGSLRIDDSGYLALKARKETEDDALGLSALEQLLGALRAIAEDKDGAVSGRALEFRNAVERLSRATDLEEKERASAEKSVFSGVWEEAQKLFAAPSLVFADCPICDTSLEDTRLGSRAKVTSSIEAKLVLLADYKKAVDALKQCQAASRQAHGQFIAAGRSLLPLLVAGKFDAEAASLQSFFTALENWKLTDPRPDDTAALRTVSQLTEMVSRCAQATRERQGEATFADAVMNVGELRRIAEAIRLAQYERAELEKLAETLEQSALRIDNHVSSHVASLLDGLQGEINRLYSKIQGSTGTTVKIGLEPPDPEAKGKLKLGLVIDFADNRKGVNPAGYLSDSQVHTIALSLRLAAIKLFNTSFPLIVLDDIVTSYDSDHRKAIATMMAEDFQCFQFILVTHDERFFRYLKDHMPSAEWQFKQITMIETDFGPKYVDHKVSDEIIEAKLANGQHAANEIRQAQEEWLLTKAREFGISLRIRDVDKPYSFERSEMASGLASFLKDLKLKTPALPGFSNAFWNSLQTGDVENFGSHFQENPNASGSVGDELKRWNEFKQFRELFRCQCGSARFKRPKVGVRSPLCEKCEVPFGFAARPSSGPDAPSGS